MICSINMRNAYGDTFHHIYFHLKEISSPGNERKWFQCYSCLNWINVRCLFCLQAFRWYIFLEWMILIMKLDTSWSKFQFLTNSFCRIACIIQSSLKLCFLHKRWQVITFSCGYSSHHKSPHMSYWQHRKQKCNLTKRLIIQGHNFFLSSGKKKKTW